MRRSYVLAAILTFSGTTVVLDAPSANADDSVTYEVIAARGDVPTATVKYNELAERKVQQHVSLPWRLTVAVPEATSPTSAGAEIRADWRPYRWRYKYVTVRIYRGAELLCESTLDVGNATCYGSTPHRNFPQTGGS